MLTRGYLDGDFGRPALRRIVQAGIDANYDFMHGERRRRRVWGG